MSGSKGTVPRVRLVIKPLEKTAVDTLKHMIDTRSKQQLLAPESFDGICSALHKVGTSELEDASFEILSAVIRSTLSDWETLQLCSMVHRRVKISETPKMYTKMYLNPTCGDSEKSLLVQAVFVPKPMVALALAETFGFENIQSDCSRWFNSTLSLLPSNKYSSFMSTLMRQQLNQVRIQSQYEAQQKVEVYREHTHINFGRAKYTIKHVWIPTTVVSFDATGVIVMSNYSEISIADSTKIRLPRVINGYRFTPGDECEVKHEGYWVSGTIIEKSGSRYFVELHTKEKDQDRELYSSKQLILKRSTRSIFVHSSISDYGLQMSKKMEEFDASLVKCKKCEKHFARGFYISRTDNVVEDFHCDNCVQCECGADGWTPLLGSNPELRTVTRCQQCYLNGQCSLCANRSIRMRVCKDCEGRPQDQEPDSQQSPQPELMNNPVVDMEEEEEDSIIDEDEIMTDIPPLKTGDNQVDKMMDIIRYEERLKHLHVDIMEKDAKYEQITCQCLSQDESMEKLIKNMLKIRRGEFYQRRELTQLREALYLNQELLRALLYSRNDLLRAKREQRSTERSIQTMEAEILSAIREQAERLLSRQKAE